MAPKSIYVCSVAFLKGVRISLLQVC